MSEGFALVVDVEPSEIIFEIGGHIILIIFPEVMKFDGPEDTFVEIGKPRQV